MSGGELVTREEAATPSAPSAPDPMAMLRLAIEQNADPDRLQKLMDIGIAWERERAAQEKERKKDRALEAFNRAMAAFKKESPAVIKNKTVSEGTTRGRKYADLDAVVSAVTESLAKHGLTFSWKTTKDEKELIEVTCVLTHVEGHFITEAESSAPDVGGAKSALQARGSTQSYLRRYTLKAILGLSEKDEDNDGGPQGKKQGRVPEEQFQKFVQDIKATTTKAAAEEACQAGVKVCDEYNDLDTWKALRKELQRQLEFIAAAKRKEAGDAR